MLFVVRVTNAGLYRLFACKMIYSVVLKALQGIYDAILIKSLIEFGLELSKYPPAKPGALWSWPLKAAGRVADAARRIRAA